MATRDPRDPRRPTTRRDPADDPDDLFRPLRRDNEPRQRQSHGGGDQPRQQGYQQPANQPVTQAPSAGVNLGAGLIAGIVALVIPLAAIIFFAYLYGIPNASRYAYLAPRAYMIAFWGGLALSVVLAFVAMSVSALTAHVAQLRVPNQAEELNEMHAGLAYLQEQNERLVDELDRQHKELSVVHQTVDEQAVLRSSGLVRSDVESMLRALETRLMRNLDTKADNTNVGEIGVQIAALERAVNELRREMGSHTHPIVTP